MQRTIWLFSVMLSASLLVVVNQAVAEEASSGSEQYEPLDDKALEREYGIKAGAVQRDDSSFSGAEPNSDAGNNNEGDDTNTEGGTGGTGSTDGAIEKGEDEQSSEDNSG